MIPQKTTELKEAISNGEPESNDSFSFERKIAQSKRTHLLIFAIVFRPDVILRMFVRPTFPSRVPTALP
jgi:hypothetical protein